MRGWTFYRGDVTFENSTINMRKDFHVGGNFTVMAAVTLKNCDKYSSQADGSWIRTEGWVFTNDPRHMWIYTNQLEN